MAFAVLGSEHWQSASYIVPAGVAVLFALVVLWLGKGSPRSEGLPALEQMMPEETVRVKTGVQEQAPKI